MEEGKIVKGGHNKKPTSKRPEPPKGQSVIKELWVVGKYVAETPDGSVWEFQGIFDDKDMAISRCKNRNWFIGPCILNECFPDEKIAWPGCEYPLA